METTVATAVDQMVANAPVQSQGRLETLRILHSNIEGSGRTDFALQAGKLITAELATRKTVKAKKALLKEIAHGMTGSMDDAEPKGRVHDYLVCYHLSLRTPSVKELGWSWARLVRSALSVKFSFPDLCDDLPASAQEKLNEVLPKLISLDVGTKKDRPNRTAWREVLQREVLGKEPKEKKESATSDDADDAGNETDGLTSAATVLQWLQATDKAAIAEMLKGQQELILKLFDACELAAPQS